MNMYNVSVWVYRIILLAIMLYLTFFVSAPLGVFSLLLLCLTFFFSLQKPKKFPQFYVLDLIYLFLVTLHLISATLDLYAKIPFTDVVLHLLWAFFLGITVFFVITKKRPSRNSDYLIIMLVVFIAGLGWELFEFFWDLFITIPAGLPPAQPSSLDTLSDLIWDIIGGLASLPVAKLLNKNKKKGKK